jgi:hypothetical protein
MSTHSEVGGDEHTEVGGDEHTLVPYQVGGVIGTSWSHTELGGDTFSPLYCSGNDNCGGSIL